MNIPYQIQHTIQQGEDLSSIAKQYRTTMQQVVAANPHVNFYDIYVGDVIHVVPGEDFRLKWKKPGAKNIQMSFAKVALRDELRKLWEQHSTWTMMAIVSILAGLPDEKYVTQRLMRNAKDFEQLFVHYYGAVAGKKIHDLLSEHIVTATGLVKALKMNDSAKATELNQKWFQNADQLASLFSSINPFWTMEKMKSMFYKHLNILKQAVSNRMQNQFASAIHDFDLNELHALEMADSFSNGLWKQFHGK